MSYPVTFSVLPAALPDHEQKQAALSYLNEAWAEARHDGVDGDCLAQVSLFAAHAGACPQRRILAVAGNAVRRLQNSRHASESRHPVRRDLSVHHDCL